MNIKSKVKKIVSFLLHGERRPLYAKISYLKPNERLKGKNIIVTGGSRGLGFSMAKKFVNEGANVLITGRNENSLKISAEQISCDYLVFDVENISSIKRFMENARNKLGGGRLSCLQCWRLIA